MNCSYCRYPNSDEQNRCRRCGRPLRDVYAMATTGALAALPRPAPAETAPAPGVPKSPRPAAVPRQASLFQDRPAGNVIPFDGVAPIAPKPPAVTRASTQVQARRRGTASDAQPSLDFLPPAPAVPRKLGTTVETVIDCDAPVAEPVHRLCAAAVDAGMIVIACGFFLTTFYLLGGSFPVTRPVTLIMAGAAVLIAMFYGFVWVCAGRQTPGMRALSLTLINFDGYPADGASRWWRYLGACLGYCAGGLGLVWALLDEESLAWHDHISKTFPTFRGPETSFVRRRQ